MKHSGNFITLGRAIFAFPITMYAGMMAFFLASIIFVRQVPDSLPVQGHISHVAEIFAFIIFWGPIGALIFSIYVLPFYISGLLIARKIRVRNCFYFLFFGCMLSLCLQVSIGLLNPHRPMRHAPYSVLIPIDLSVGLVSGFACWAFLYLTRRPDFS